MSKFLFYINDILESLDIHTSKKTKAKFKPNKTSQKKPSKKKHLENN